MKKILITLALLSTTSLAQAEEFGSMRTSEVNVRSGPGTQYPILWIFQRKYYPVEILDKYQSWYKIKDIEGEQGWVYRSLISKHHTSLIKGDEEAIMYKSSEGLRPRYRLEPGVIVSVKKCGSTQCKISYHSTEGWINKKHLTHTAQ